MEILWPVSQAQNNLSGNWRIGKKGPTCKHFSSRTLQAATLGLSDAVRRLFISFIDTELR